MKDTGLGIVVTVNAVTEFMNASVRMRSSVAFKIVLCLTICLEMAHTKSPNTSLKGFQEDYANVAKTCSSVGFVKDDCRTRKGPSVIAFSAIMTNRQSNLRPGAVVQFKGVTLNEGGGYDAKSSVFTAPSTGVYVFDWTTMAQSGKYVISALHANGKDVAYQRCNESGIRVSCTTMGMAKLEKGGKAWIRIFSNRRHYVHEKYSHISGFRL